MIGLLAPVLASIFPILSFYASNMAELSLNFLIRPIVYAVVATAIIWLVLVVMMKNKLKAGVMTLVVMIVFFSYGHISRALQSKIFIELSNKTVLGPDKLLLPIVFLGLGYVFLKLLKNKRDLFVTAKGIAGVLALLILFLGIRIGSHEVARTKSQLIEHRSQTAGDEVKIVSNSPDVYYIILDGYAREDVLRDTYGYDNSEFVKNLRDMGFFVADQARSNYIQTYISLPSSLNMRYLDDLPENYGEKPVDGSAARDLVTDSEVVKKFRDMGYEIINFATTWEGTDESFKADKTYMQENYFKIMGKTVSVDESEITFLQTTLLSPLIQEVWGDALRSRTLTTLQKLPTIPTMPGKKFVMVHIVGPHPPYVFQANGDPVPGAELEMADEGVEKRPKYLGQLEFLSNQILPVLGKIIKNSAVPPVIIVQSDHGPASIFGKRDDWVKNYSEEGVKERSSILYSIYLPDHDYRQFYQTITPVNTFRIFFNKYFGENLELLPDKTCYTNYDAIYKFEDVTDIK